MNISSLQNFYNGFQITDPAGNNAFSLEARRHKQIFVPPLEAGGLEDLAVGDQPVFGEVRDGKEFSPAGLRNFVYFPREHRHVFIFDNHNHAFSFWAAAAAQNIFPPSTLLVHVDQHTDLRDPSHLLTARSGREVSLDESFRYANYVLNVGNFLKPALALKFFSGLEMVTGREALDKDFPPGFALDLDMDFFSEDMAYIDEGHKKERVRRLIKDASFITVATSPYFMDQSRAISLIKELFA